MAQASIPKHCFKRDTFKSMRYTVQDLVLVGMLFYCATLIDHPAVPFAAKLVLWPMYVAFLIASAQRSAIATSA